MLAGAFVALDKFKRNDLIIPRIVMADVSLSGMSRSSAGAFLKGRIEKFCRIPTKLLPEEKFLLLS